MCIMEGTSPFGTGGLLWPVLGHSHGPGAWMCPCRWEHRRTPWKAMPLPKHTISTISQYKTTRWCDSSQWEGACGVARLTDSRERLGKSESRAASMEVGATRWMLLRVTVVVVPCSWSSEIYLNVSKKRLRRMMDVSVE